MRESTCCFTGHRKVPPEQADSIFRTLRKTVSSLSKKGYKYFVTGGALGFDTMAAMAVIDEKRNNPDVNLILMLPCTTQAAMWSEKDRRLYENIKHEADTVTFISKEYFRGCMHERNRRLVDASSLCVCYMTRGSGGTAYTVKYAENQGVDVVNIADETAPCKSIKMSELILPKGKLKPV